MLFLSIKMSLYKIVIFTVVSTFIMLGDAQMETDSFTRADYLGLWHVIREMVPESASVPSLECAYLNVMTRGYNSWKLRQFDTRWVNNVLTKRIASGTIRHSQIHLQISPDEIDAVMSVTKFNHGEELIIIGGDNRLISRTKTASPEAIREFRRIASELHMVVYPSTFDTC